MDKKEQLKDLDQKKQYHHLSQLNSGAIEYDEFIQKQIKRAGKYKKLLAQIQEQEIEVLSK